MCKHETPARANLRRLGQAKGPDQIERSDQELFFCTLLQRLEAAVGFRHAEGSASLGGGPAQAGPAPEDIIERALLWPLPSAPHLGPQPPCVVATRMSWLSVSTMSRKYGAVHNTTPPKLAPFPKVGATDLTQPTQGDGPVAEQHARRLASLAHIRVYSSPLQRTNVESLRSAVTPTYRDLLERAEPRAK